MIWGIRICDMRYFSGPQGGPFAPQQQRLYGTDLTAHPQFGWMRDLPSNARKSRHLPSPGPHLWVQVDRCRCNLRLRGGRIETAAGQDAHALPLKTAPRIPHQTGRGYYCIHRCRSHTGPPCILQDKRPEKLLSQSPSTIEYVPDRRLATVLAPVNKVLALPQGAGKGSGKGGFHEHE